jgi:hypothetical protein
MSIPEPNTGCWLWLGSLGTPGYGTLSTDHLSVGSRKDNSIDMSKKGRGSFNKLTFEQRSERMKRAMQTMGTEGLKSRGASRSLTCSVSRLARVGRLVRINLLSPSLQ